MLPEINDYTIVLTIATAPMTKHQITQCYKKRLRSLNMSYVIFFLPNLKHTKTKITYLLPRPLGFLTSHHLKIEKQSQAYVSHSVPALTQVHSSTALQSCGPQLFFPQILIL